MSMCISCFLVFFIYSRAEVSSHTSWRSTELSHPSQISRHFCSVFTRESSYAFNAS